MQTLPLLTCCWEGSYNHEDHIIVPEGVVQEDLLTLLTFPATIDARDTKLGAEEYSFKRGLQNLGGRTYCKIDDDGIIRIMLRLALAIFPGLCCRPYGETALTAEECLLAQFSFWC